MRTYLVKMCNADGSTPLGECPEYEYVSEDYHSLMERVFKEHPEQEIVSWGLKDYILKMRKEFGIS